MEASISSISEGFTCIAPLLLYLSTPFCPCPLNAFILFLGSRSTRADTGQHFVLVVHAAFSTWGGKCEWGLDYLSLAAHWRWKVLSPVCPTRRFTPLFLSSSKHNYSSSVHSHSPYLRIRSMKWAGRGGDRQVEGEAVSSSCCLPAPVPPAPCTPCLPPLCSREIPWVFPVRICLFPELPPHASIL